MPSVPGIEDHLILPSGRNFNSVQEYLQFTKMRQLGVFGTCLEIMVFSFISAVAVNVYSYVTSSWLLFSPPLNQTRVANIYIHKHDHYEPIITVTNNSNSSGPSFVTLGSVCDSDDDLPLAKLRKFPEGELHNLVSEDDDLPLSSIIEQKTTDCNLSTSNREKCCRRVFEFDFASTIFRASKSKVETVFHEMQPFCPITTPSLSQHQVRKERRKQRNHRYRAKSNNQLRNLQQTKTRLLLSESNRLRNLCNVTTRLQDPIIRRNNLLRSKNRVLDPAKRLANLQRTKKRLLEPRARATNLNRARQRLLDPENRLISTDRCKQRLLNPVRRALNLQRAKQRVLEPAARSANLQRAKQRVLEPAARSAILQRAKQRVLDPAARSANLQRAKQRVLDPAARSANLQRAKQRLLDPAARSTNLQRAKQRVLDPAARSTNLQRAKQRVLDPAARSTNLQRAKQRVLDPAARSANLQRAKQRVLDPAHRLHNFNRAKQRLQDSVKKSRNLQTARERYNIPTLRLQSLKRAKNRLSNPAKRLMNLVTAKSRLSDPVKRAQNLNRSKQRKSLEKAKLLKNTSFVSDLTLVERISEQLSDEVVSSSRYRKSSTERSDRQKMFNMLNDHLFCNLSEPLPIISQDNLILKVRGLLSSENLLERACLVCDLLVIATEGNTKEIQALSKTFIAHLRNLTHASKVMPALPEDLLQCYNIVPILINNGIEQKKSDSFRDPLLSPRAVMKNNVFICFTCFNCISKNTLPKLSIANNNAIGCLPDDLLDVTDMEVRLCSFVVPKLSFQTVRGGGQAQVNSHSILFDSPVVAVAQTLPRLDAVDLIRVITTTSIARCVPIHKSLKFVEVRVPKVRKLLQFFSKHRKQYELFGQLDENAIVTLGETLKNGVPKGVIETADLGVDDDIVNTIGTGYFNIDQMDGDQSRDFVYVNNAVSATYTTLNSQITAAQSHEGLPADNRFFVQLGRLVSDVDPSVLALVLPAAFPYGRGSCDETRRVKISRSMLFERFLKLSTKQFARSKTAFGLFFDMESRARALTVATLSLPTERYARFTDVTVDQMKSAITFNALKEKAIRSGSQLPSLPPANLIGNALHLLQQAKFSAASMLNTPEERLAFRKNVLAQQVIFGNPSLFLTINPADVQSPVLALNGMAGTKFVDELHNIPFPSKTERFQTVSENPVATAQCFHHVIQIMFKHVLGINPDTGVSNEEGGVFGKVYSYTGGIEQQARLTLHIHILVWLVAIPTSTMEMKNQMSDERFHSVFSNLANSIITSSYSVSPDLI